ncbi:RNA 3'-terminal-phosphate cyclase (ATP) [Balamuthia mandrillaris]
MPKRKGGNRQAPKGQNKLKQEALHKREKAAAVLKGLQSEGSGEEILIDGSLKEGGGQILRNTFALSGILKRPIRVVNIRANRSKGGLRPQHLTGLLLVTDLYKGVLSGGQVNSTEVSFYAGDFVEKDRFYADIQTAGSIGLLIQISLPCLIYAPRPTVSILKGGTNALNAPQVDYTMLVFRPIVQRMGLNFDVALQMRGFYPRGGGCVELHCTPLAAEETLSPLVMLERGDISKVHIRTFVSGKIPLHVPETMCKVSKRAIRSYLKDHERKVEITEEVVQETEETAFGDGTGLIIIATTTTGCILAGSALGERGKKSEAVAEEAVAGLIHNLSYGGCVDEYLQDQLIIWMALASGLSRIKTGPLTLHTETSIHFTQLMTGAVFTVTEEAASQRKHGEQTFIIECQGIGLTPAASWNAAEERRKLQQQSEAATQTEEKENNDEEEEEGEEGEEKET